MSDGPMSDGPMSHGATDRPPAVPGVTPSSVEEFVARVWPAAAGATHVEEISGRHARVRRAVDPASLRPGAQVSGPTQFGMADAALWYACFGAIGLEAMAVTSEMSIRFLRPCRGEELRAEAVLESVGRRSIVGSVRVWADDPDRPTAVAQGTYVRPPAESER